jgi:hypothetical protein
VLPGETKAKAASVSFYAACKMRSATSNLVQSFRLEIASARASPQQELGFELWKLGLALTPPSENACLREFSRRERLAYTMARTTGVLSAFKSGKHTTVNEEAHEGVTNVQLVMCLL